VTERPGAAHEESNGEKPPTEVVDDAEPLNGLGELALDLAVRACMSQEGIGEGHSELVAGGDALLGTEGEPGPTPL
jgi:hypothetical protein